MRKWIYTQMLYVEHGERPIDGDDAVFAPSLGFSLLLGQGTTSKFLYSVFTELKAVCEDMYISRSDMHNTSALLPQMTKQEQNALETAFQNTLNAWYNATHEWVTRCRGARTAGGEPQALTFQQANEKHYFNWNGFKYAEPPPKAPKTAR